MTVINGVGGGRAPWASLAADPDGLALHVDERRPWRGRIRQPPPFDLDALDRMVSSALRAPAIRMVRCGQGVPLEDFCTPVRIGSTTVRDAVDPRKALDLYRRGATMVVQSLQRIHPPTIEWCCELEAAIGWPVQANAYLSPPHAKGLARHADGHDVVVVQLFGTKAWVVDGLGRFDLDLGDALYIPADTEHEASTTDQPSLHLTVGIHRPTHDRLASAAFRRARERTTSREFSQLADELRRVEPDEVVEELRRPPRRPAFGLIAGAAGRWDLDEEKVIAPRGTWSIGRDRDSVTLTWDDQRLRLPARTAEMLEVMVGEPGGLRIGDLPAPGSAADRLVVARRLLDENAAVVIS